MSALRLLIYLAFSAAIINIYIYLHRNDFEYTKQSSYKDLYQPATDPSISHFELINDSTLSIKLNSPSATPLKWFVKINDTIISSSTEVDPTINVKEGVNTYSVFSSLPDTLLVQAEYYPKQYYQSFNDPQNGGMVIYKTNCTGNTNTIIKWGQYEIPKSNEDAAVIATIIKDTLHINKEDKTFEKIKKLACFLYTKIYNARGIPSDSTLALPAFEQYKAAMQGKKIWCGMYATIFKLFADAAGITTRYIEIRRSYGNITGSEHVLDEYYIPEQRRWAAIDLMFNNIAYKDIAGNLMNAVDVKNANPSDSSITVVQAAGKDSVVTKPFSQLEPGFFDLYNRDKELYYYLTLDNTYSFKEKFKRYITKDHWYEVYSDNIIIDDRHFYIKQFFIILEIVLLALILLIISLKYFAKKA